MVGTRGGALPGGSHGRRASLVEESPWIGVVDCVSRIGARRWLRRNGWGHSDADTSGRWVPALTKEGRDRMRGRGRAARRNTRWWSVDSSVKSCIETAVAPVNQDGNNNETANPSTDPASVATPLIQ
ncbi:hypothetical protein HN51_024245, partial [Arachis hypogaea]